MNIHFLTQHNTIIHIQKRDENLVFVPLQFSTFQAETIRDLAAIIESGMFAVYNRPKNRVYLNSKVYQAEGIPPAVAKVANLSNVILPTNDANDEVNSAEIEVLSNEQFRELKIAVLELQHEANLIVTDAQVADKENESKKFLPLKPTSNQKSIHSEEQKMSALPATSKQEETSDRASVERVKDEKASQERGNQKYNERIEAEEKAAIKKKIQIFEEKHQLGIL